ncbi:MAG: hypothetical protein Q4B26_01755 [Eubacteriales bacterium]|nr:hypothetical protein [Eubacteriales bacterium]
MKIKRLKIQKAGEIENQEVMLQDGINVLTANQKYRVDLYQFLDTMFFDKEKEIEYREKKESESGDASREEYTDCKGVMWFEKGKESFRLTRDFVSQRPYHELLSETTGALTDARKGSLDKVMYPISRHIFENSGFIQGFRSQNQRDQARELQTYFSGYEGAGDSTLDLGRTVQLLKMSRKGYQDQEDRRIRMLRKEQEQVRTKELRVRDEVERLRSIRMEQREQEDRFKEGQESDSRLEQQIAEINRKGKLPKILIGIFVAACIIAAILVPVPLYLRILLLVAAGLFFSYELMCEKARKKEISKIQKTKGRQKAEMTQMDEDRQIVEEKFEEKARQYLNLHGLAHEYGECVSEPTPEKTEVLAINLAMETLQELSDQIFAQMNQPVEKRISQILREITDGEIRRLRMDENLHIIIQADGGRSLSMETMDKEKLALIFMALRLASGEVLSKGECFPVIFEGFFEKYSDDFCRRVLRFLAGENRQFLLSGENPRILRILEEEQIPHNVV